MNERYDIVETQEEVREYIENNSPFRMSRSLNNTLILDGLKRFPEWLQQYTKVKVLSLQSCFLSRMPAFVRNLTDLEIIYLDNNHFESFPKGLLSLKQLQFVSINDNKIYKVPSLAKTRLGTILMARNQLSVFPSFPPSIQSIDLSSNKIEYIPPNICNLVALDELILRDNLIESIPSCFSMLPSLHDVNVDENWLDLKSKRMLENLGFAVHDQRRMEKVFR